MADNLPSEDELAKRLNDENNANTPRQNPTEMAQPKAEKPKKPLTTLESIVDESSHIFGSALKVGLAGAVPYAFGNSFPSLKTDAAVLTGAQIASDYTTSLQKGKKYTPGNLLESVAIGTAITGPLESMFSLANKMPLNSPLDYVAKAGVWGGIVYPVFNGFYLPVAYLIRNRTFKGMGKYVKENYWPILKKSMKYILPFSLLNVFFVPPELQIAVASALSFVYDRFTSHKGEVTEDQKRDKTPYLVAAPTAAAKLVRNSVKGAYDSLYAIGSGISDVYKSITKPGAVPVNPAPAGAHA